LKAKLLVAILGGADGTDKFFNTAFFFRPNSL